MKRFIFAVLVLFTCTSINTYPTIHNLDNEVYKIKKEINLLYEQGKLSESDINNLIKILE